MAILKRLAATIFLFLVCSDVTSAQTEGRVALVVGNSAYQSVARLPNAANDARLVARTLKNLGFKLVGGGPQIDLDKTGLDLVVQQFGIQLSGASVALFYYAGHGVQVRGNNYLVPVSANPTREVDVDFQMVDTRLVLRQMEAANTRLNLLILDACRNNPFATEGLRSVGGGLAPMRAPEGTLISYATQPGNVAIEGTDGDSPFTKALVDAIQRPGLGIFDVFNQVGMSVKASTGRTQVPWVAISPIEGQFFFVPLESTAIHQTPTSPERAPAPTVAISPKATPSAGTSVQALTSTPPGKPSERSSSGNAEANAPQDPKTEDIRHSQNDLHPDASGNVLPQVPSLISQSESLKMLLANGFRLVPQMPNLFYRLTATFSPDGKLAFVNGSHDTLWLWGFAIGEQFGALQADVSYIPATLSPDGGLLIIEDDDDRGKGVSLLDVQSGRQILKLKGHHDVVQSAAFSPNGKLVITASNDKTARLWDIATGKQLQVFVGHRSTVFSGAVSPDEKLAITASEDNTARLWDTATGRQIRVLEGHGGGVRSGTFSPDGALAITASQDNTARIWEVATGKQICVLRGHGNWVNSAKFSADRMLAITASDDHTARLWDVPACKQLRVLGVQNDKDGDSVYSAELSPDGRLALVGYINTVRLWDVVSGTVQQTFFRTDHGALSVDADGLPIEVAGSEDEVYVFTRGSETLLPSALRQQGYDLPTPLPRLASSP